MQDCGGAFGASKLKFNRAGQGRSLFEPAGQPARVDAERAAASVAAIGKGWKTATQEDVNGLFGQNIVK